MTQDMELAAKLEQEGSWERALREAEAATIARNVARWRLEKEKRERREAQELLNLGLPSRVALRELKRQKYQLRNCRATLAEIVAAHQPKGGSK